MPRQAGPRQAEPRQAGPRQAEPRQAGPRQAEPATPQPALHPWNRGFQWRMNPGPYRALTPSQAAQFDRDGYVVVPDVFDPPTIARVTGELDGHERRMDDHLRRQPGGRLHIAETGAITFSALLLRRSALLRQLATSAVLLDVCRDLIGPDVNVYWDQAVYKKPEKPRRFPWHQDNGYNFVEPQSYLTCWIALVDATVDNGCPLVAPGLHRLGTLEHHYVDPLGWECFSEVPGVESPGVESPGVESPGMEVPGVDAPGVDAPGAVAAEVRAGGMVVFSSLTPHLTGPNVTDEVRKAYILQYAPAGARRLVGDPRSGETPAAEPVDDPGHQFPVLRGGLAVAPPPLDADDGRSRTAARAGT